MNPRTVLAIGVVLALLLTGCGGDDESEDAASSPTSATSSSSETAGQTSSASSLNGDLIVFAAASLTDSFTQIGEDFMAVNPDVTVTFNFAGSSALAQQITAGAPVDVFAAASPATMQVAVDAQATADEPEVFVRNTLQIAVPPENAAGVTGLADFANEDLTIALCAVEVPCGAAAERVFEAAGLVAAPDTLEQDVRAALSRVELGEVDAALVYRTDVIAAGDAVQGIDFAEAAGAVNDYPIAALAEAPNTEAAAAFVEYVLSSDAQQVFTDAGFDSP